MPIQREQIKIERAGGGIKRTSALIKKKDEPDLASMFEDTDNNPVEFPDTGDYQADVTQQASEELKRLIEFRKSRADHFRASNDARYFVCLCFQTTEQKEEFLEKAGWDDLGLDFINGLDIAKRLGVDVQYIPMEALSPRGKPDRYKGMTLKDRKKP